MTKICLGVFDRLGKRIRTKVPKPGTSFYIVFGTIRKKIAEHPDSSPYEYMAVTRSNKKYCDTKRMFIETFFYPRGKEPTRIKLRHAWLNENKALDKILESIERVSGDTAKRYKVKSDEFYYK